MKLTILALISPLLLSSCLNSTTINNSTNASNGSSNNAATNNTSLASTDNNAKAAATMWLNNLGSKGLVLDKSINSPGFIASHNPSALGRITKFTLNQAGIQLSLAFKGELSEQTSAAALNKAFWYIALDKLPTPGLAIQGWDIKPSTATSSIEKGVKVLAYGNGKIKLQVNTSFFALYGKDTRVNVPAGAATPDHAYFQIRQPFPLDLTLEAPVNFQ